jgi:hypothetical protein
MLLELKHQLWMSTPHGVARAIIMIDRGDDGDTQWVCIHKDGCILTYSNWQVKVARNITMGIERDKDQDGLHFGEPADHRQELSRGHDPIGDELARWKERNPSLCKEYRDPWPESLNLRSTETDP